MIANATYLFALLRPDPAIALDGIHGIGDSPLRSIAEGELAAIACDVPLSEFSEQALKENLEDLQWLERMARVHDLVVRRIAQQRTTAPLRLATIYRDDGSVRELLRSIAGSALEVLSRLDNRDEWGVKIYATEEPSEPESEGSTSGADYLRRRRTALTSRRDAAEQASELARQIYLQLADVAADARAHRLQDPQLSGIAAPMLLNGAFLLDRPAAEDFGQLVKNLEQEHPQLRFTLTGPWPSYSFAALDSAS